MNELIVGRSDTPPPPHTNTQCLQAACRDKKARHEAGLELDGGDARIRTGGEGFAGPCLTTWPRRHPGVLSYKELVSYPTSSSKTMERTTGFEPATLTLAR